MNGAVCLRLLKFSIVGAIGVVVQLGVLAALEAKRMDSLPATAIAVESAIIHNFCWHRHFTWGDQARSGARDFLLSLFRFHMSNGLLSLLGNLLLMQVLVGGLKLPLLQANLGAIGACSVANFVISDRWVFPSS